jgi:hypothetical protein
MLKVYEVTVLNESSKSKHMSHAKRQQAQETIGKKEINLGAIL